MVHVQAAHMINIYELGLDAATNVQHNNNNNHNVSNNNNNNSNNSNANAIVVDESTINKLNGNGGEEKIIDAQPMPECSDESDNASVNSQIVASAVANVGVSFHFDGGIPPGCFISFHFSFFLFSFLHQVCDRSPKHFVSFIQCVFRVADASSR